MKEGRKELEKWRPQVKSMYPAGKGSYVPRLNVPTDECFASFPKSPLEYEAHQKFKEPLRPEQNELEETDNLEDKNKTELLISTFG